MSKSSKLELIFVLLITSFSFFVFPNATLAQQIPPELNIYDGDWCNNEVEDIFSPNCPRTSPWYSSNTFYMPATNSASKVVRLNFIIVQKDDGTGNFQQGDPEHEQIFNDILTAMNSTLINMNIAACGGTTVDTKIQFQMNKIYIQDTYLWNNDHDLNTYKCPDRYNWYLKDLAQQIDNDPSIPKGIDVFFTCGETAYTANVINNDSIWRGANYACSMFPSLDINDGSYVHMPDAFIKYYWMKHHATIQYGEPWIPVVYGWYVGSMANALNHELGHSFALGHEYTCTHHNIMDNAGSSARDFMTDTQIAKIHRSLAIYNTRKFVVCQHSPNDPLEITQNGLIDFDIKFYRDIIINPGVTLNVTCKISMAPDSRIIVKPGGILVIDGGIITSTDGCNQFWRGIELWGNSALTQIPMTNQGKVQIINEGSIENAEIGILVGKRMIDNINFDPSYAGGLIWCTDGNFVNNKISVLFTPYPEYNHSFFRKTDFMTSNALNGSALPDYFVKAFGTSDVKFYGCSFKNTRAWNVGSVADRGNGIYCYNSRIYVLEQCLTEVIPCSSFLSSSFENLSRGVYAMNNGSITHVDINNTNFYDDVKGLYLSGYSGASNSIVTNSNFRVYRPGEEYIDSYGMYLNECSGYQVEGNTFYSEGAFCDGVGLIVNNSICNVQAEINRVYRNTFTNLGYASIAQNINRNAVTGEGLCYKCNKFFDNYSDISVTKDPFIPPSSSHGIAVNQGANSATPTGPAGNMFDYTPLHPHWDIDNGLAHFNYFYHYHVPFGYRVRPDYKNGQITLYPKSVDFTEATACPPSISGGGGSEDLNGMASSAEKADSITGVLTTLVDGGSTETLKDEVVTSTPPESLPTRDELLSSSPYVSDTVMQVAIEKEEVLNNAMIRDIMVANPHSAKSEIMINMLENRTVPMPDYMMAEILQGEDSISGKENLEAQKAFWNAEGSIYYHNLIRHYRNDTVNGFTNDSLIYLLQLRNTIGSYYDLTAVYFQRGQYETGLNLLNQIPISFSLSENQQVAHQAFVQLFNILKNVITDTSSVMNISSTDIQTLQSLTTSEQDQVSAFARNLLIAAGKISYSEPIFLPEGGFKSSKRDKYRGAKSQVEDNLLKIYPNPAKTHFVVEYNVKEFVEGCYIEISDIMGKTLNRIPLTEKEDQKVIPVNDMIPGIYIVSLINNGKPVQQAKITLIR